MESEPDRAIEFIVSELSRADLADEWRDVLVYYVEDIHLPAGLRQEVGERLLEIACTLRGSERVGAERVVWSALRRAASLQARDRADRFLPFLDRQAAVDTRSVALRCIERVFETAPATNDEVTDSLKDRVAEFAFKFLDEDVFAGGENALIAQNAVCALAALGDHRFGEALVRVNQLGRPWMNRQVHARLEHLSESWRSRSPEIARSAAFRNLDERLKRDLSRSSTD